VTVDAGPGVAPRNGVAARAVAGARTRDLSARARDRAAAARDEAARARDDTAAMLDEELGGRADSARAAEMRVRATADRVQAAADREQAAIDRDDAARELELLRAELVRAQLDDLTGAYRRPLGELELANEIARARRSDGRLVLAFVVVDSL
jgi:hypothetical protein